MRTFATTSFIAVSLLGTIGVLEAEDVVARRAEASLRRFQGHVKPLLVKYCVECHGPDEQNAKLRLDRLDPDMAAGDDGETWHDALNELNQGAMPPEDADQPTAAERAILVDWMTDELKRATAVRRSTGGRVVLRRLTRYEYENTLRDLLGIEAEFAEELPPEPASADGFRNDGVALGISPRRIEHYLKTARWALQRAIVVGERPMLVRFENEAIGGEGYGQNSERQIPSAGMMKFPPSPLEGPFRVLVTASAEPVPGAEPPVLSVHLGYRNSPNNFRLAVVGERTLTGTADRPQTFELRGRMENFPHPDPTTPVRERRNPGLRMGFGNSHYTSYPAGIWLPEGPDPQAKKGKRSQREILAKQAEKATAADEEGMPRIRIHSVVYEAPYYEAWPPAHHRRILFESPSRESDERAYARAVVERFTRRAFRRPTTKSEIDALMRVFDDFRPHVESLELAIREVLTEVLVAPEFLFLLEPTDGATTRTPLTQHEVASRLSYLLWSTMPDEELFAAAEGGRLREPADIEKTVRRMLADDRHREFVDHFTDQWLHLDELNRIAVNPDYYPEFDDALKGDMRRETQAFFAEILDRDLSALNLVDSDFVMLNRPMAAHYGLDGPRSNRFERVALAADDPRGGLLGQASILLRNSSGDDSHPVYRGAWIRDRFLGDPPASPPPDVPELEEDDPDGRTLSLAERFELHRSRESCSRCHADIDPWGVPLENFDAVGRWRDRRMELLPPKRPGGNIRLVESTSPVEAVGVLPSGTELRGPEGLKSHLLGPERDRFVRAFVRRVLTYALGRHLELIDEETVDELVADFVASGHQIDELLVAIAKHDVFLTK